MGSNFRSTQFERTQGARLRQEEQLAVLGGHAIQGMRAERVWQAGDKAWQDRAAAGNCTPSRELYTRAQRRDITSFLTAMTRAGLPGAVTLTEEPRLVPKPVEKEPEVAMAAVGAPGMTLEKQRRRGWGRLRAWKEPEYESRGNGHSNGNGSNGRLTLTPVETTGNGQKPEVEVVAETDRLEWADPAWTEAVYPIGVVDQPRNFTTNEQVTPTLAVLLVRDGSVGTVPSVLTDAGLVPHPYARPLPLTPNGEGKYDIQHGVYDARRFDVLGGAVEVPADVEPLIAGRQIDGVAFMAGQELADVLNHYGDELLR